MNDDVVGVALALAAKTVPAVMPVRPLRLTIERLSLFAPLLVNENAGLIVAPAIALTVAGVVNVSTPFAWLYTLTVPPALTLVVTAFASVFFRLQVSPRPTAPR